MQRYHDVISSFGGKTSYDADNRPLLVMRSNLWASGYDVDGTDQTSLGQLDRKSGSAGMPRPISYAVFCLKKKNSANSFGKKNGSTMPIPIVSATTTSSARIRMT